MKQIGFLIHEAGVVLCTDCAAKKHISIAPPLYEEKILPYKQTCHNCGKVLVDGTKPELFSNPNNPKQPQPFFLPDRMLKLPSPKIT